MPAFGAPKETRTLTLESIGSLNRRVYLFHHRSKILEELTGSTFPQLPAQFIIGVVSGICSQNR